MIPMKFNQSIIDILKNASVEKEPSYQSDNKMVPLFDCEENKLIDNIRERILQYIKTASLI